MISTSLLTVCLSAAVTRLLHNAYLLTVAELENDGAHRDPFDRLLVCESRVEPTLLLSADPQQGSWPPLHR
jgi:PIN domain nuclease of toxin-antitoxin system